MNRNCPICGWQLFMYTVTNIRVKPKASAPMDEWSRWMSGPRVYDCQVCHWEGGFLDDLGLVNYRMYGYPESYG